MNSPTKQYDIILIGAGIMSATLATLIHKLQPDWKICIIERADTVSIESSDALNNAGTGHSARCELNYTPQNSCGTIAITKAIEIMESFEVSKQFWASLVQEWMIGSPESFINPVPHMSLVRWDDVQYLHKRYETLQQNPLFTPMQYSTDLQQITEWMPLIMSWRNNDKSFAATRSDMGTDVNFWELTRAMVASLQANSAIDLMLHHHVSDLNQQIDQLWTVSMSDTHDRTKSTITGKFVFWWAGGWALPLLEKSGIKEIKGYGGFPIDGQWLICRNPEIVSQHWGKVYGKSWVDDPPMSVPHLDTRIIDGEQCLLFWPFAGFTTKFLKAWSVWDLPMSVRPHNIMAMIAAWRHNLPLTSYLIKQIVQNMDDRLAALREYMPTAQMQDWELEDAGKRVQIIKSDPKQWGILQFGTEVVTSADRSISWLLWASPWASTAVSVMIELLQDCFPEQMNSSSWTETMKQMIPSYGQTLTHNPQLTQQVRHWTSQVLKIW